MPRRLSADRERLGDRRADGHPRIQRGERVLEDHLHPPASIRDAARLARPAPGRRRAAPRPRRSARARRARARASTCPEPDSPTRPTVVPLGNGEVDPVDGGQAPLPRPKLNGDAVVPRAPSSGHVLQARGGGLRRRSRGSPVVSGCQHAARCPAASVLQQRTLRAAAVGGDRAARREGAARRLVERPRRTARDRGERPLAIGLHRRDRRRPARAVYGCAGPLTSVATSSSSTIRPGVHHDDAVAELRRRPRRRAR